MSQWHKAAKHTSRTRTLRPRWQAAINRGEVACWRCGRPIVPGQLWDMGHVTDLARGGDPNEMLPEHRGHNRSEGGRLGAKITNTRQRTAKRLPNW